MLSTLKVSEASVLWLANSLHSSKLSRCLGSVYISSKIANTSLIEKKTTTFFASILVQFSFLIISTITFPKAYDIIKSIQGYQNIFDFTLETHTYNIFSDYVKRCQNQMI